MEGWLAVRGAPGSYNRSRSIVGWHVHNLFKLLLKIEKSLNGSGWHATNGRHTPLSCRRRAQRWV